ncbi:hypothetical protein RF11_01504 [Thelohanellus kitauei]|uniref:Uncharacterized protein n=1 Tax=Thelohanellus kitauei TaxID=669202 RepID=A0A0C2MKN7_THEKT|nr:hypothetical protein RF11_01504 [Thelohanellus kitauei]
MRKLANLISQILADERESEREYQTTRTEALETIFGDNKVVELLSRNNQLEELGPEGTIKDINNVTVTTEPINQNEALDDCDKKRCEVEMEEQTEEMVETDL